MGTVASMAGGHLEPRAARGRANDFEAEFARIFEHYYPNVFAYVYSRTSDVETSRDLVAETFERRTGSGMTYGSGAQSCPGR